MSPQPDVPRSTRRGALAGLCGLASAGVAGCQTLVTGPGPTEGTVVQLAANSGARQQQEGINEALHQGDRDAVATTGRRPVGVRRSSSDRVDDLGLHTQPPRSFWRGALGEPEMGQSDSQTQSSRVGDVTTVGKAIIKEPVREAVREALEEQQRQTQGESGDVTVQPTAENGEEQQKSGGMSRGRKALGLILGLALFGFLLRRREKVLEAEPVSDHLPVGSSKDGEDAEAENFEEQDVENDEGVSYDEAGTGTEAAVEDG